MKHTLVVVSLVLLFLGNLYAGEDNQFKCKLSGKKTSAYFQDILEEAERINQLVCDQIRMPTNNSAVIMENAGIKEFGTMVKTRVMDFFKPVELAGLEGQLSFFKETLGKNKDYPVLDVTPPKSTKEGLFFFLGNQDNPGVIKDKNYDKRCEGILINGNPIKVPCSKVLKDLQTAIEPCQQNINSLAAYKTSHKLTTLSKDWDAYFASGRAQTFVDIAVTSFFERKHMSEDFFNGPPKRQWFALHPNLVVEYLDGAPDGEDVEPGLLIEWLGVNVWKKGLLPVPIGISVSSLYSDRPGVDDVGHGLTFHIDNKYTLGWATHGGDNGFYFSIDLLKLVEDKNTQVKRYRENIIDLID